MYVNPERITLTKTASRDIEFVNYCSSYTVNYKENCKRIKKEYIVNPIFGI